MNYLRLALGFLASTALISCSDVAIDSPTSVTPPPSTDLNINFETYTLGNGLDVVLHVDRSDPVVAINLAAHVGSSRETPGRTGFAHLFEHLLFLDSENLGYGGLDEMNTRIGGEGTNGFTTHDMTQYFQAVPKDALEKVIWAEADKLGWFIKTVNQNVIDNEKQVVKNEKRQRVDNQPYGHALFIVNKTLYPEDHPYNWQVIGSLADLDEATLKDTKDFFSRWYVPNNVTVTISGDFDVADAKKLVEKYFGEIPRGENIDPFTPQPSTLSETTSLYYEDNFAQVPQLVAVWPTVEQYHPDSYALDILVDYLTNGKRAPLNEVLIDEDQLTSDVSGFSYTKEISGEWYLFINPNEGEDIDALLPSLSKAFTRFEQNGISEADLDRIKAGIEVDFYGNIQSALGKAIQLAEYNLFADDPGFYRQDIAAIQSVTTKDVMRVYDTYIKDNPRLYLSIVPKDETQLKLDETYPAQPAKIVKEKVVAGEGAPVDFDPASRVIDEPTTSSFDRTVEPNFGETYDLPQADIWRESLSNGVEVYGLHSDETPLINFSLRIDAGRNRGDVSKPAIPYLTAQLMQKGTSNKTTAELEDAIKALGSSISISNSNMATFVSGTTLKRNFDKTVALVQEILTQPRWDREEFDILKRATLQEIVQSEGNPNAIAARENSKLQYPPNHIYHYTSRGPAEKLDGVTLDDLKAFHANNYSLEGAKLRIVGDYDTSDIKSAFGFEGLTVKPPTINLPQPNAVDKAQIYFYDVSGSKQSVLRINRPSLNARDEDYPLAEAINFPLGGIYTSKLNTELRVNKGYTYGVRSGFNGDADRGSFGVSSSVRTNVTKESIQLIRDILSSYGPDFTSDELNVMKDALLRGQALKNETLSDKLGMLGEMSAYDYPADYRARNAAAIKDMTLDDVQSLTAQYIRPDAMNYLVVGDAETQLEPLKELGLGDPIILNE